MKKILMVIISLLNLFILTGCGCSKKNINDNEDITNLEIVKNEQLLKEETLDVFKIKNTEIIYDDDMTRFTSSITNLTNEVQNLSWLKVYITYVDLNDIERNTEILISVGDSLQPNETISTTTKVGADLRNTRSVSYEVIK